MSIPLLGYVHPLSGRAGDTLGFKVSSSADESFTARLVRIVCADPNPEGPGIIEHPVDSAFVGSYPSRVQPFYPGSYLHIPLASGLALPAAFSVAVNIWPTRLASGAQTILAVNDPAGRLLLSLGIGGDGRLCGRFAEQSLSAERPLRERCWYRVGFSVGSGKLLLLERKLHGPDTATAIWRRDSAAADSAQVGAEIRIAAALGAPPTQHFNGKLEAPTFYAGAQQESRPLGPPAAQDVLAAWDFSIDMSSTRVVDTGPNRLDGELVNLPARAMTGAHWSGDEMCWRHAPEHYGAIHFHEDDIYDFEWETDFSFTIPADLPSGVYAMRLECAGASDSVPFFVCAPRAKPTASLCVLVSTFTYAVYGNHARPDFDPSWKEKMASWKAYPWNPAEHPRYGLSTYNFHTDGSGICHASHRRPLFNLRPGYLTFCNEAGEGSGLRHFQADSHLLSWLEAKGIDYDLITDRELHDEGRDAIAGYRALTTGSHPEYHTRETLDALTEYRDAGGRLLYLGGNGFYWKVACHAEVPGAIEIRRGESGIRAWAAEPGEYYNAFDGGYGGLWRRNGRAPQALAGVGFSAQGTFLGSYYRRTEASRSTALAWIFEGIDEDIIGDFGLSGGGAAGFELDRVDSRLGTPDGTVVLARSEGHGDTFVMVPEEQLTHLTTWSGQPAAEVIRADMVYLELDNGGRVFSTGSITFCGSLPVNNFENNVSRLLENVIREFLRRG